MDKKKIGQYELIRSIAKGGMGEVFLAYDPVCKREIALKCIRSDLANNKIIYKRFMKEALIASQLMHPNIIPIYSLSKDNTLPYYTMPYIEGKTLKMILVDTLTAERSKKAHSNLGSIPHLIGVFQIICEAMASAHSGQIIHRDLKPENILVGKYGEVLIFDWGVADKVDNIAKEDPNFSLDDEELGHLTSPGKIIGTISFMAPERFSGTPANFKTDIYSLGVMLYMILSLKLPFKRKKLKETKENIKKEVYVSPIEVAPYRDIPHGLAKITKRCLEAEPDKRYQSIQDLLTDLRCFTEGRSEWVYTSTLDIDKSDDWSFHENVLISKHQAISLQKGALEWISLMISKEPFENNCSMETKVTIKNNGQGVGLLLSAPTAKERVHLVDGYYLWLSANPKQSSHLYRNNVEVLPLPNMHLKKNTEYKIRLEKIDHRIQFYLDGILQFSYISYLPLMGTHVGIVYKDDRYQLDKLDISLSSPTLVISCLSVPDAFLSHKMYDKALKEYQRIGKVFFGRHESREALFRSGLTLIEKSKASTESKRSKELMNLALIEFEKLKPSPGAPLEYLGKALVYQNSNEIEEELKCLELAIRRYPRHPLLYLVYDHIIYRMYQSSHKSRIDTYRFILLALRYNSYAPRKQMIDPFILSLIDKKKMLFFLNFDLKKPSLEQDERMTLVSLSYLLNKPYILEELIHQKLTLTEKKSILVSMWSLGEKESAQEYLSSVRVKDQEWLKLLDHPLNKKLFKYFEEFLEEEPSSFQIGIIYLIFERFIYNQEFELLFKGIQGLIKKEPKLNENEFFIHLQIVSALLAQKSSIVQKLLTSYKNELQDPHQYFHFYQGCFLHQTQGFDKAKAFFMQNVESPLPKLSALVPLYVSKKLPIKKWLKSSFDFEKGKLYKMLYIFNVSANHTSKANYFHQKWKKHAPYL